MENSLTHITLNNVQIPISIKRQDRKSVRFKFSDTTCHISAPFFLSDEKIVEICLEKKSWLIKAYEQATHLKKLNEMNRILGHEVTITYIESESLSYQFNDSHLRIYKTKRLSEESALKKIKEMMAFDLILPLLSEVQQEMNVHINSVHIRQLKSSWGRCNSKKDISLSLKLLECPIEFIRYVCIHECAHTRHMNHSPDFWDEVKRYCPNYKVIRKSYRYTL